MWLYLLPLSEWEDETQLLCTFLILKICLFSFRKSIWVWIGDRTTTNKGEMYLQVFLLLAKSHYRSASHPNPSTDSSSTVLFANDSFERTTPLGERNVLNRLQKWVVLFHNSVPAAVNCCRLNLIRWLPIMNESFTENEIHTEWNCGSTVSDVKAVPVLLQQLHNMAQAFYKNV